LHIDCGYDTMTPWTFWQFVTPWDRWPFRDWYNMQDAHVRNACDFTFRALRVTDDWRSDKDMFRELTRAHSPLSEICFRADNMDPRTGRTLKKRRIRVFGMQDVDGRRFAAYGAGEEVRIGHYLPLDAADDALRFYRIHLERRGDLYEIEIV
jgi:hypothetical protein